MTKSASSLLGILIINFLLPPIVVILILVINGTFNLELLYKIISTWPLYVFVSPFLIGIPLFMKQWLKRIRKLKERNDQAALNRNYTIIQILFVVASIVYGMAAVPICKLNNFSEKVEFFATITTFFYLFNAVPPMLLLFNRRLDEFFADTSISANFPFKLKFRVVAVFSALGGVSTLISSSYILLWRFDNTAELKISGDEFLQRLVLVGLIVVILQSLPNLILGQQFSKLFTILGNYIRQLSNKDLAHSLTSIMSRDEFGEASRQINSLRDSFKEVVMEIKNNSNYLQISGNKIEGVSQKNSDLAARLAGNAEEVAASLEEISSNLNISAGNAKNSADIIEDSKKSIEEINNLSATTYESIKNIFEKVSLIEDLASQTDILAINAYIEAAQAGEHGKGFSVIAKTIRTLADQSKIAASTINKLSLECISNAEISKTKIEELVEVARLTSDNSQQIASSSKEQLSSVEHINSAVQEFNSSTQFLASSSQELASTSEKFSENSKRMNEILKAFRLKEV